MVGLMHNWDWKNNKLQLSWRLRQPSSRLSHRKQTNFLTAEVSPKYYICYFTTGIYSLEYSFTVCDTTLFQILLCYLPPSNDVNCISLRFHVDFSLCFLTTNCATHQSMCCAAGSHTTIQPISIKEVNNLVHDWSSPAALFWPMHKSRGQNILWKPDWTSLTVWSPSREDVSSTFFAWLHH